MRSRKIFNLWCVRMLVRAGLGAMTRRAARIGRRELRAKDRQFRAPALRTGNESGVTTQVAGSGNPCTAHRACTGRSTL